VKEEKRYDKPFSHPRWHEPIGGKVVGHKELSEEKQKKAHEDTIAVLKSMGVEVEEEKDSWHDEGEK
jgi:trimethylamine:corrinoid methyltransferase-like protein